MSEVMVLLVQGLFTVALAGVGLLLRGLREDIKEVSRELKNFVTKEEAKPRWERLHNLGDRVAVLWSEGGHTGD